MKKLITLLLVLCGGITQVSASTETTVYYAVSSATVGTCTVKLNVNFVGIGDADWHDYVMTKTAHTYDGKDVYSCTYTDKYDGVQTMQIQLYEGGTWKSQQQPYGSWTSVATYNKKMYIHDTGWALLPWEYYFMSGTGDTWSAVETMTNTDGTYTYSFSGADYAGKRVSWAPGTSFKANGTLESWNNVSKSKTTADNDDWILFQNFSYASVDLGSTGSAWYVPASDNSQYNDGTITISFNSSDKSATITSAKTTTISDAGYATYSNGEKYSISGATAYKVSANNTTSVTLTEMDDDTVYPAGEGIILKGNGDDAVTINSVAGDATPSTIGTNYLVGTGNASAEITVPSPNNTIYVFANDATQGVGFYKASETGTLAAHKAYLDLNKYSEINAREFLAFVFDDEETTSISTVQGSGLKVNGYYDLQGRRVAQPTKGLYIVNGKKVVIK